MNREQEIDNAVPNKRFFEPIGLVDISALRENDGFRQGAKWADEHPSEETKKKICRLLYQYYFQQEEDGMQEDDLLSDIEYIDKHWYDE